MPNFIAASRETASLPDSGTFNGDHRVADYSTLLAIDDLTHPTEKITPSEDSANASQKVGHSCGAWFDHPTSVRSVPVAVRATEVHVQSSTLT